MMNSQIKTLWEEMVAELKQKDPHGDWPSKKIVMRLAEPFYFPGDDDDPPKKIEKPEPWILEIHSYSFYEEEHETVLEFVREKAVKAKDFDENSIPPELLEIIKDDCTGDDDYPNGVFAKVAGKTLEEAIAKMRQKLQLLDHGYILMDWYFYRTHILNKHNGKWML